MTNDDLNGPDEDLVTLTVANDDYEAALIAGRLHEEGITSRLAKRSDAAGGFIYKGYDPGAPVAVLVPRARLKEAKGLFERTDLALPPDFTVEEATNAPDDSDSRPALANLPTLWLLVAVLLLSGLVLAGFDALIAIWDALTGTP